MLAKCSKTKILFKFKIKYREICYSILKDKVSSSTASYLACRVQ